MFIHFSPFYIFTNFNNYFKFVFKYWHLYIQQRFFYQSFVYKLSGFIYIITFVLE